MNEKIINLKSYNPLDIYGVNDANLNLIKKYFPKLKIIARGNEIKILGDNIEISLFEKKFALVLLMYDKFGRITQNDIMQLLESEDEEIISDTKKNDDILVHGQHGLMIKAKTRNQRKMVEKCRDNDLVIAIGPAGTGKTYNSYPPRC